MSDSTLIEIVVSVALAASVFICARWAWKQRPVVVWDERRGMWRGQRDMSRGGRG